MSSPSARARDVRVLRKRFRNGRHPSVIVALRNGNKGSNPGRWTRMDYAIGGTRSTDRSAANVMAAPAGVDNKTKVSWNNSGVRETITLISRTQGFPGGSDESENDEPLGPSLRRRRPSDPSSSNSNNNGVTGSPGPGSRPACYDADGDFRGYFDFDKAWLGGVSVPHSHLSPSLPPSGNCPLFPLLLLWLPL